MTKGNKNKWWLNGGRGSGRTIRLLCEVYENKIAQLEQQIEEMKCCGNCSHRHYWGNELGCNLDFDKQFECDNNKKKYWEFRKE